MSFKVVVPSLTLFDTDGNLDLPANRKLWERHVRAGMDGILLLGSNGEFYAVPEDQRSILIAEALATVGGQTEIIVGTGQNSFQGTLDASNGALRQGADAVMIITPYYFGFSGNELVRYFLELASQIDGEIYLYNFPGRTGNDLTGQLVREIVEKAPNVVGIKDTVADMAHTRHIANEVLPVRPDFKIYCGMDENYAHNALIGGYGGISAICNIFPDLMRAYTDAINAHDRHSLATLQKIVNAAAEIYSVNDFFVPVLKYVVRNQGIEMSTYCRSILSELTVDQKGRADHIVSQVNMMFADTIKD